ncbi:MBOAT family O-acyltransferase [Gillisia sp. Q332]|uniref:MBOAT family O-acyltransferase n=1 Tax=Gillisia xinjiangensis TaxID=3384765 RepID=UPI00391CE126
MLFNSFEFLIFLPIVFLIYWLFKDNLRIQNIIILISSYIFYGWWDYRFLALILISTIIDYTIGLGIQETKSKNHKKILLLTSIVCNLGLLMSFKYFNFFIDSWVDLLNGIGYRTENSWTLNIILPVGISFYTFQTMSYTIDIYRNKLKPTRDFISFASFVSFFPQLVAGPIERATNFLPQILTKRTYNKDQVLQGVRLIIWGLFKKVVIADSLGPIVDEIFETSETQGGGTLWLGAIYFAFQIYCDFSGYSDIAIGTAKLFGFELMSNFKFPFFSRNIGEFWRRWHISLSTWFRDYLYIPIGGSKNGKSKAIRNILIIFIVSGFWHGANWTFIAWGTFHAILFLPSFLSNSNRKFIGTVAFNKKLPTLKEVFFILRTFILVTIGWVFFRSETLTDALTYLGQMSNPLKFTILPNIKLFFYMILLLILEWNMRHDERNPLIFKQKPLRIIVLMLIITLIILNFGRNPQQFIYFDF